MNIEEALAETSRWWETFLAEQWERVRLTAEAAGVNDERAREIADEELAVAECIEAPGAYTAAFRWAIQRITMEGSHPL